MGNTPEWEEKGNDVVLVLMSEHIDLSTKTSDNFSVQWSEGYT